MTLISIGFPPSSFSSQLNFWNVTQKSGRDSEENRLQLVSGLRIQLAYTFSCDKSWRQLLLEVTQETEEEMQGATASLAGVEEEPQPEQMPTAFNVSNENKGK